MNIDRQEIERQLRLGEDRHWEFKQVGFRGDKPTSPARNDLADEIAAFANTDGGVLLCGVTDAGEAQGLSREQMDALEMLVVEVCSDSINPPHNPRHTPPGNCRRQTGPAGERSGGLRRA